MLIQELKEHELGQAHMFQEKYFKSSQIHQLTIMFQLKHTSYDILESVLFQNLYGLFMRVRVICISNIFRI